MALSDEVRRRYEIVDGELLPGKDVLPGFSLARSEIFMR